MSVDFLRKKVKKIKNLKKIMSWHVIQKLTSSMISYQKRLNWN